MHPVNIEGLPYEGQRATYNLVEAMKMGEDFRIRTVTCYGQWVKFVCWIIVSYRAQPITTHWVDNPTFIFTS